MPVTTTADTDSSSRPSYDLGDPGEGAAGRSDVHMGEPGLLHKLVRFKKLEGVFLFITSRCNSKCRTCFYHDRLDGPDDLTFEQIRRIAETSPKFDKLWLSGGEPFLREELADIIKLFYDRNGVKVVNLPTNGLLTERIVAETARILELCPGLTVHLNSSLDGPGKVHDANRGIPGNFEKTIRTMQLVRKKLGGDPRLLQNVATVITPDAYDSLYDLGAFLVGNDMVATHFFEIVRGSPRDPATKTLTPERIREMRLKVMPLIEKQADNLFRGFSGMKKKFAKLFFLGFIRFVNDIQDENYTGPRRWGMACTAGKTTFVIDANGDFRSCEIRPPIGNLRDYGYDLTAALHSDAMRREIAAIGGGKKADCWCTHGCWIMSSIKFSPRALLFRIPAAYRRFRKDCPAGAAQPASGTDAIARYR